MIVLVGPSHINGLWTATSLSLPMPSDCANMQAKIGAPLKQWTCPSQLYQGLPLSLPLAPSIILPDANSRSCESISPCNKPTSGRYKTEMCRTFRETGDCRYGEKCQFAHGFTDLRNMDRHPKFKSELCRTFHAENFCKYGERCHFIHNDVEQLSVTGDEAQGPPLLGINYTGVPLVMQCGNWDSSSAGEDSTCSAPSSSGSNTPSSFSPGINLDKEVDDPFSGYTHFMRPSPAPCVPRRLPVFARLAPR